MKLVLTIAVFLGIPLFAFAAACVSAPPACPSGSICLPNPLKYDTFDCLVEAVIGFLFVISLALAPLMVLVGAFYLMTAGGDPGRVKTAKTIFIWTGVGVLVVLSAKGLVGIVRNALGTP